MNGIRWVAGLLVIAALLAIFITVSYTHLRPLRSKTLRPSSSVRNSLSSAIDVPKTYQIRWSTAHLNSYYDRWKSKAQDFFAPLVGDLLEAYSSRRASNTNAFSGAPARSRKGASESVK